MKYVISENRLYKIIDKFVDSQIPQLRDVVKEKKYNFQLGYYGDLFSNPSNNKPLFMYWLYNPYDSKDSSLYPEIELQSIFMEDFVGVFGEENLGLIIDWFNKTFNLDAQSITS